MWSKNKKWTCAKTMVLKEHLVFLLSFFPNVVGEGRRGEGRALHLLSTTKIFIILLLSLLLDFLIVVLLRPNKNDALFLGAKACIVSFTSSFTSSSSSSFSEGKLALVETNREKREEDIFSRDAWSPRVRFRSRRPRRPRRRRVDFSRRRQHRRRRHRRDVRITRATSCSFFARV